MPELLTESFCERCGTRYTFEATTSPRGPLRRLRILTRGLKTFILSDDTSFSEALADARSAEERELSSQQLDAFHRTFNFCMSCRQYTCANCWNEVEGRCLSCAPHLGREILPAPFPTLAGHAPLDVEAAADEHLLEDVLARRLGLEPANGPVEPAWPEIDLAPARAPEPEAAAERPSEAAAGAAPQAVEAVEAEAAERAEVERVAEAAAAEAVEAGA
ncbi:MAG TPA: hypothetical protein VNJ28_05710, partial [Candidatus Limnocylindrales bacterium]|nr:hypothetical protein [Candidatus Limnocylindrales bacterium]